MAADERGDGYASRSALMRACRPVRQVIAVRAPMRTVDLLVIESSWLEEESHRGFRFVYRK